jgi:hypothetical protein
MRKGNFIAALILAEYRRTCKRTKRKAGVLHLRLFQNRAPGYAGNMSAQSISFGTGSNRNIFKAYCPKIKQGDRLNNYRNISPGGAYSLSSL